MIEFIILYRARLAEEKAGWIESTGEGAASDWDDYKRRTGYIGGLAKAEALLAELAKHYLDDDEQNT